RQVPKINRVVMQTRGENLTVRRKEERAAGPRRRAARPGLGELKPVQFLAGSDIEHIVDVAVTGTCEELAVRRKSQALVERPQGLRTLGIEAASFFARGHVVENDRLIVHFCRKRGESFARDDFWVDVPALLRALSETA